MDNIVVYLDKHKTKIQQVAVQFRLQSVQMLFHFKTYLKFYNLHEAFPSSILRAPPAEPLNTGLRQESLSH